MADILGPTLISRDNDANTLANPIFVNLSDGTDTLTVNADGSINVTIVGGSTNTQYAEDSAAVSGDIGTVALVVRKDTIASNVGADGDYATLLQDANGRLYVQIHDGGNSITVDGTVTVTQATGTNLHTVVDSGAITVNNAGGASAVNIQDGGNSITVDGAVTVSATDLDIRDLNLTQDAVKISGNATANSLTNPIFVQLTNAAITGEVNDYNTGAAVAAAGTSNHDYTVTSTMKLKSVICASSGKGKFTLQVGPVASLVTKGVQFTTPTDPNCKFEFDPPIEVPSTSTGTIRIIRLNRENQAQDVYSTIIGIDN